MSTKFTKGPWKTDFCEVQHCWSLNSKDEEITMAWASEAPTRADAHLIASAPDLYEALRCFMTGEGLPPGKTIEGILAAARGES